MGSLFCWCWVCGLYCLFISGGICLAVCFDMCVVVVVFYLLFSLRGF